jgi:hypothetical protein
MAKRGIKSAEASGLLRASASASWALCIGAGTSRPIFPTWQQLVQDLLTSGADAISEDDAKTLRESFPPEALIRATQELLGLDDAEYRCYLTRALYSNIKKKAGPTWPTIAKCLMAHNPGDALPSEWKSYLGFLSHDPTTATHLASVILRSIELKRAPSTILSFNAEPLLLSTLNALSVAHYRKREGLPDSEDSGTGPGLVDRIEGSTSWSNSSRIPYFFCHGFLPVDVPLPKANPGRKPPASYDSKMVFSETDYLNLANSVFSWQSSVFTRAAMSDRIVFVGLSLTDPNMRRWLSWIHSQRLHEIKAMDPEIKDSTQHLWINVSSGSDSMDKWIEALVSHLGVRLVWISNWPQVGPALSNMLSLPKPSGPRKVPTYSRASRRPHPTR